MSFNYPFTIGADPEFFILNKRTNTPKSIIGMIGGTKNNPKFIDETNKGFAIQEDNVAAEFNIPITHNRDHFAGHINFPMEVIGKLIGTNKFSISTESAISFPDEELNNEIAWIFGCEPDYDAWNLCINEKPSAPDKNLRTAGGHIHVGYDWNEDVQKQIDLVKAMDYYLGVWSVIEDSGDLRKQLYGKAGAFRPKPYGIEYRVLSNFWIFNKEHINNVWDLTQKAVNFVQEKRKLTSKLSKEIQHCINSGDKHHAAYLQANWV